MRTKRAGEWTRARTIATDLLAERELGPLRAEALVLLLAELESVDRSVELLEEALREATLASGAAVGDPLPPRVGDALPGRDGGHARAALELADEVDDDALRARARVGAGRARRFAGEPEASEDLLARTRELADAVGGDQLVARRRRRS